ncbi:helix-turn-helix domain-containing protein [Pusillimonas sp. CC-YST705]|uniref:Shikimate kinase n=1 Tax=Mesopusillimonas faecipullorum TaxID=2755040 RepID=A0ABS8CAD4_9BURK|nr:shikimate kinase [Mesopusillimonas faecipullorum]MCB5362978.1 helix-turn-helix domain-containing protein [Mesopusillimonas faecipullorum]
MAETMQEACAPDLSLRIGQRVRACRAARAMTMKQLAGESGISLPYLSRVEKGDGNVSVAVLSKLAMALGVEIDSLISEHERFGADYALIVELLKRQSPQQLKEIRGMLLQHAQTPQAGAPRRIALVGLRGAGKSTLGPLLAQHLGIPFTELNREVEREAGLSLDLVFSLYGQAGFRRLERRCLDRIVASNAPVVLATGGGIVVETSTYEVLLHSFQTVWLHAAPQEHFRRVMAQHDARIATPQLRDEAMRNIEGAMHARRQAYALAHTHVDTTNKSVEHLVQEVAEALQGLTQAMAQTQPSSEALSF